MQNNKSGWMGSTIFFAISSIAIYIIANEIYMTIDGSANNIGRILMCLGLMLIWFLAWMQFIGEKLAKYIDDLQERNENKNS